MFTLGGLETLPTGEVLDVDGNVIPKLYAAGRTTAGLPRTGKGYASGMFWRFTVASDPTVDRYIIRDTHTYRAVHTYIHTLVYAYI